MTHPAPIGNKDAAIDFLRRCSAGDVDAAYAERVAPAFIHHNPWFKGDAASLKAGMADNARRFPGKQLEILRALEDGELVAVHCRVRMTPEAPWVALIHLFRFADGRIAELWEAAQMPPENSPNEHGMF